jgi:hypothetical protein
LGTIKRCEEKLTALHKILEKYSADYLEHGDKYAKAAADKVATFVLDIEHISGKARRK